MYPFQLFTLMVQRLPGLLMIFLVALVGGVSVAPRALAAGEVKSSRPKSHQPMQMRSDQTYVATLGGWVWYDSDRDGIRDANEPGLGRVTLDLWLDDGDGRFEPSPTLGGDTFITMSVTDWAGRYDFNLPAVGGFFVDVRDINGVLTNQLHLASGQSDPTTSIPAVQNAVVDQVNFGYVTATDVGEAVVGDLVWLDTNRNGGYELNEPVIAGVEICAAPLDGKTPTCTFTDAQGRYRLRVAIGGYRIGPTNPPVALLPTTSMSLTRYLVPGERVMGVDFGFAGNRTTATATLGGTIWQDLAVENGAGDLVPNGILDAGETGRAGVGVRVSLPSNSGQWDATAPALILLSSADGGYNFSNLTPGTYLVKVTDDLDRLRYFTVSSPGPIPGADGQNQTQPFAVTLAPGAVDTRADFGYRAYDVVGQLPQPGPGTIGDLVWFDQVADGIYNPATGDVPLAGVTVDVYQNNLFLASTTTDPGGRYLIAGLGLGNFQVSVSDRFRQLADTEVSTVGVSSATQEWNHAQPYAVNLGFVGFENRGADFGYRTATSSYAITQQVSPSGPVRVGEEVRFSVRITNTGSTWLTTLPLHYVYDTAYLRLVRTTVAADDNLNDGRLDWGSLTAHMGDLAPAGQTHSSLSLVITFSALSDTGSLVGFQTLNTALARNVRMDPDGPGGVGENPAPLPDRAAQAGATIIYPTATTVVDSHVTPTDTGVMVNWRTISEATTLGFNLWRTGLDGSTLLLNPTLIPAYSSGQPSGGSYQWEDVTPSTPGSGYVLEVLDVDGTISRWVIDWPTAEHVLFLPLITDR